MLDSILWVGPSRGHMAGTQPRQQTDGAPQKGAIKGWRLEPLELYKYNGNLLHLNALSSLEVVACGRDFCRRKVFVCMRRLRICRRKRHLLENRESRRVKKRESLLQYLHYGHVSRRLGAFKAHFVAGYVLCSRNPIPPSSFNAPPMGTD